MGGFAARHLGLGVFVAVGPFRCVRRLRGYLSFRFGFGVEFGLRSRGWIVFDRCFAVISHRSIVQRTFYQIVDLLPRFIQRTLDGTRLPGHPAIVFLQLRIANQDHLSFIADPACHQINFVGKRVLELGCDPNHDLRLLGQKSKGFLYDALDFRQCLFPGQLWRQLVHDSRRKTDCIGLHGLGPISMLFEHAGQAGHDRVEGACNLLVDAGHGV